MEKSFISKLFFILLLLAALLLFRLFWTYISAIILALLIASAFYPLYSWVKKLLKGNEQSASLLMSLFIMLVLIIPVGGFVGTLSNEAFDFYSRTIDSVSLMKIQQTLQGDSIWAQRIRKAGKLTGIELNSETLERLATLVGSTVGFYLSGQLRSVASNLLSFLIHFFLMILIIFYLFRDGFRLKDYISKLLPFPIKQQELVVNKFREMGRAIIIGNGLSGIIQGVLGGLRVFSLRIGITISLGYINRFYGLSTHHRSIGRIYSSDHHIAHTG